MIVVLSDTHIGDRAKALPVLLLERLKRLEPELILHAGDITAGFMLDELEKIAPLVAVRGNADSLNLPLERVVEVGDFRIGLIHGHRFLSLNTQFLTLKAINMDVDVLVFGHTHRRCFEFRTSHGRRVYLLNPGSPTFPRFDSPSFAVLKFNKEPSVQWVTFL